MLFLNQMLFAFPWKTVLITSGIIIGVLLVVLIVLSLYGRKMQTKQEASKSQMEAASQTVSLLVIDKKRIKLKEAGLPKIVLESTPRYLRGSKVPIVKAKIGPKIMSLMCDEKIFPLLPIKKEVKAVISGIYIMDVKGRGVLESPNTKKIGMFSRMRMKALKKSDQLIHK